MVDRGYLRIQRAWRDEVGRNIDCPLLQVETDVVVPVETASNKEAYSAGILRPKIHRVLDDFLVPAPRYDVQFGSCEPDVETINISDPLSILRDLGIDNSVSDSAEFSGGTSNAIARLNDFITDKLDFFDEKRNEPSVDMLSGMSPYLHFGQISPLYIALRVLDADSSGEEAYLEELIVRRELSMNFVFFNEQYDDFSCLPQWAQETLLEHKSDKRGHIYALEELERSETHDEYWNAAQREMVLTGKMHGYMRMYWGKKILEWSQDPREAFQIALQLNNKYEIDGRDPNGYAGVAWCFGKHDRAWKERSIFGKVRYMNDRGLERKFDIEGYVKRINSLH